jgi:hypothetical protein
MRNGRVSQALEPAFFGRETEYDWRGLPSFAKVAELPKHDVGKSHHEQHH